MSTPSDPAALVDTIRYFPGQGRDPERDRHHGGSPEKLPISGFLKSHIEVIDDLVGNTGAPSRSALINATLDATLPEL